MTSWNDILMVLGTWKILMYRLPQADRRGFENRVGLAKWTEAPFQKDQSPL
jgi:hypothetical protein